MPDRRRLLVIDDDRKIAQAVAVRLKAAGYDVRIAHDGDAGLTAVAEQLPDAIVLDLRMPIRDGLSVLHALRAQEETADVPVVVLSASAVDKNSALHAGAQYFLPKPHDSKLLLASIESALGNHVAP